MCEGNVKKKIFYSAKLTFRYKEHKQTVINMQKLKEYYSHEPFLGNILEISFRETKSPERIRHKD